MDVQHTHIRDRVFSILNDNDSPSFVIRQKQAALSSSSSSSASSAASPQPTRLPSISTLSPRLERPQFLRQSQYGRNSSVSSVGSPPLLRFDSSSSKSSSSSMESSPSPITPAYNFQDAAAPYDHLLRTDLGPAYLPSPSTITPFMEHQLMIAPLAGAQLPTFEPKAMPPIPPMYPGMAAGMAELPQLPTPSLSHNTSVASTSSTNTQAQTSPVNGHPPAGKKNKYPCPYAQSHSCLATFTTSGHAARHGKKHTGEKGVHCPVCNKAFTRKDNMKQHERTHKHKGGADDTRSKAAITKDAQKAKGHRKTDSEVSTATRRASLLHSPLSEVTSLAANTVDTPKNLSEPAFYPDPATTIVLPADLSLSANAMAGSLYPPLIEDTLLPVSADKFDATIPMPPTLIRGFSDLDTLAQVAESFDPYYPNPY